jgi:hypothetical protein
MLGKLGGYGWKPHDIINIQVTFTDSSGTMAVNCSIVEEFKNG